MLCDMRWNSCINFQKFPTPKTLSQPPITSTIHTVFTHVYKLLYILINKWWNINNDNAMCNSSSNVCLQTWAFGSKHFAPKMYTYSYIIYIHIHIPLDIFVSMSSICFDRAFFGSLVLVMMVVVPGNNIVCVPYTHIHLHPKHFRYLPLPLHE